MPKLSNATLIALAALALLSAFAYTRPKVELECFAWLDGECLKSRLQPK